MEKRQAVIGAVGGVIGTILVGIAIWLTVVYTGAYNVAASDQHFDAIRWTLDTTMHRSVASRAGGAPLPETASGDLLAEGAGHYATSCAHCHGAPAREPAEWSRGMRPEPPHLTEAATEWTPEEIYWIVANGIKMTGMPAFDEHHAPEEIAAITAFVGALPGLSADDYSALADAGEEHSDHAHGGEGEAASPAGNTEPQGE